MRGGSQKQWKEPGVFSHLPFLQYDGSWHSFTSAKGHHRHWLQYEHLLGACCSSGGGGHNKNAMTWYLAQKKTAINYSAVWTIVMFWFNTVLKIKCDFNKSHAWMNVHTHKLQSQMQHWLFPYCSGLDSNVQWIMFYCLHPSFAFLFTISTIHVACKVQLMIKRAPVMHDTAAELEWTTLCRKVRVGRPVPAKHFK